MPKTILDRYNDAGGAGKLGSSSIPTRPLKKVHLVPVWDTDNNVGRVVKASDLLTDNPAFVMTMIMSGAYSIVLGTAVYDGETPPNLVSAEIQWADGTAGTIERDIIDGNGSTEDTFSRIIPGATTKWYKHTTLYDVNGAVKGGGFMAPGGGLPVLTVTEVKFPFVVYEGDTPDLCETNTGIQAIRLKTINTEELVKVVPPSGWKVSSDEGVHWKDELSLDCSDGGVTIWVRLKETDVDTYAGTLSVSVGVAYEELSLTGYICDGDRLPYYILLPQQLDAVRDHLDADHEQVADIDLSPYTNWVPIGESGDEFTGTYNGGGYKITGLVSAPATGAAGLFGELSGATITDLEIEDGDVTSANSYSGLLFGKASTSATAISGCVVSGTVEGSSNSGGLGGIMNGGTITECGADVEVTGTGTGRIGGLLGLVSGAVSKCYALGDAIGVGNYAGGLVGALGVGGTIADSYAQGDVSATTSEANGGLVGGLNSNTETITNSYSTGVVNNGVANNGLIGVEDNPFGDPVLDSCYWDITINSGLPTPNYGAVGTTTANMKKQATYVDWDFTAITGEWEIEEDAGYPTLQWQAG